MIPTAGRIVEYTLTAEDAKRITSDRVGRVNVGNAVAADQTYPLMITRVWGHAEGSAVNGQVLLDGSDSLWVTSRVEGPDGGQWRQFPRV